MLCKLLDLHSRDVFEPPFDQNGNPSVLRVLNGPGEEDADKIKAAVAKHQKFIEGSTIFQKIIWSLLQPDPVKRVRGSCIEV